MFFYFCPQKQEVQAPVQVKKNKKKNKTDVKPVQLLSSNDGKEPDDGTAQPLRRKCHNSFSFSNRQFNFMQNVLLMHVLSF